MGTISSRDRAPRLRLVYDRDMHPPTRPASQDDPWVRVRCKLDRLTRHRPEIALLIGNAVEQLIDRWLPTA